MITVKIIFPNNEEWVKEVPKGTTPEELLSLLPEPAFPILACRIHRRSFPLRRPLMQSCEVQYLDLRDPGANMSYQSTLSLLYVKAVHDVCGASTDAVLGNSLSRGLFTHVRVSSVTDELARKIEQRMRRLREENLPIEVQEMDREGVLEYLKKNGPAEDLDLFRSSEELQNGMLCTLKDESMLFFDPPLPSIGYLYAFEIRRFRSGLLLRFPHPSQPDVLPEYQEQRLLYDAFSEEKQWEKLLGVCCIRDLNRVVEKGDCKNLILLSEALHEKRIAEIAGKIVNSKKRIVLIAGPSSSGKTTFAKRLCIQLQVLGRRPLYLGTDDYFINREDVPYEADGTQNFEDLSAVDTQLLTEQMNALLKGEKADIPEFDFLEGKKIFGRRITSVTADQPIVIEGIHGLNPALTQGIPEEQKFRIYISPLTQMKIDPYHRIPTTDARLLRRMVRDHRTRGKSAEGTIGMWKSVRAGEEKNIFPYNGNADVFFNSQCVYELAVLKKHAVKLLQEIKEDSEAYPEAVRLLRFLQFFRALEQEDMIPANSIVREFIGGSILSD